MLRICNYGKNVTSMLQICFMPIVAEMSLWPKNHTKIDQNAKIDQNTTDPPPVENDPSSGK